MPGLNDSLYQCNLMFGTVVRSVEGLQEWSGSTGVPLVKPVVGGEWASEPSVSQWASEPSGRHDDG